MLMKNPEFKKNVLLEWNPTRFFIPVVVLALISWIGWYSQTELKQWQDKPLIEYRGSDLFGWLCAFGFFFSIMWGSYLSATSLTDEVKQKTWDFLRMSSLSPARILMGKLFGATSLVWTITLLGALPLTLFAASCMLPDHIMARPEYMTLSVFAAFLFFWMLFSHALALFFAVSAINNGIKAGPFSIILPVIIAGVIIGAFAVNMLEAFTNYYSLSGDAKTDSFIHETPQSYLVVGKYYLYRPEMGSWYGISLYVLDIFMMILGFFAAWLVMATYRLFRKGLLYKDTPFAWIIFLFTASAFLGGFNVKAQEAYNLMGFMMWPTLISLTTLIVTCFYEAGNVIRYKSLGNAISTRHYMAVFRLTPLWSISLVMFVVSMIVILSTSNNLQTSLLFLGSIFAFLVRDILILHVISWSKNIRRPSIAILIYFIVIYGLAPTLANTILPEYKYYFFPLGDRIAQNAGTAMSELTFRIPSMTTYWVLITVEVLIAVLMFHKRWKSAFGWTS